MWARKLMGLAESGVVVEAAAGRRLALASLGGTGGIAA
jgi:hypothetical protein